MNDVVFAQNCRDGTRVISFEDFAKCYCQLVEPDTEQVYIELAVVDSDAERGVCLKRDDARRVASWLNHFADTGRLPDGESEGRTTP